MTHFTDANLIDLDFQQEVTSLKNMSFGFERNLSGESEQKIQISIDPRRKLSNLSDFP